MRPLVAVIETIVEWIGPVFSSIGYVLIPVATALETAAMTGLLVPGDVVFALGGVFAARGELDLPWVLVAGLAGGMAGQATGWWLGHRYGAALLKKLPLPGDPERRLEKARDTFDRHGGKAVFIGRFATGISAFTPFAAGTSGMRFWRFVAFAGPAVALWGTGVALLGYFLGENLGLIDRIISRFGWIVLALIVIVVGVVWFVRRRRRDGTRSRG
ncbi:MAG TPA: DedA family protein [Actinomycetota bacterium]